MGGPATRVPKLDLSKIQGMKKAHSDGDLPERTCQPFKGSEGATFHDLLQSTLTPHAYTDRAFPCNPLKGSLVPARMPRRSGASILPVACLHPEGSIGLCTTTGIDVADNKHSAAAQNGG